MTGIYRIHNKETNKCYVGQSVNISKRLEQHMNDLERNVHHSYKLQEVYNQYGMKSFYFEVLEICAKNLLSIKEKFYIEKFNSLNNGYNVQGVELHYNIYEIISQTNGLINNMLLSEENRQLLKNKIQIVQHKKISRGISNKKYTFDERYDLSNSWFSKNAKDLSNENIIKLQRSLFNHFKYKTKYDNIKECAWTTFYNYKEDIQSKGNIKLYTPLGSDSNRKSKNLAFMCNIFVNEFKVRELEIADNVDREQLPLMVLVRWILSNMDKSADVITLYLPSKRMRDILNNWLQDN